MILSILEHTPVWVWALFCVLPVTMIVGLFLTKYVAGVCLAINPVLAANSSLTMFLSLTYRTVAGLFWGRTRSLLRLTRSNRAVEPA